MQNTIIFSRIFTLSFLLFGVLGWGQASLPFSYDGGKSSLPAGLSQTNLGTDNASSPKLNFDDTNDELILNFTGYPGDLKYKLQGSFLFTLGTFTISESDNGVTYTTLRTVSNKDSSLVEYTDVPKSTTRYIKWEYTSKFIANIGLGSINLVKDPNETIWTTANTWTNGVPNNTKNTTIDGAYSGAGFVAENLTVNATKSLIITTGSVDTNAVINNGTITIKDGTNFKHESYTGIGSFTLEKATVSNANKYVFWSSPVASKNMYSIYSTTSQYAMSYNSTTDYYDVLTNPTTGAFGKGYSVKVPVASGIATFTGTPNLGAQTITINKTLNSNGNAYNLIGNPYPTNFNLATFYSTNNTNVSSSFYFWSPNLGNNTQAGATATVNPGWAVYNATSSTWSAAASGSNSIIRPGQAFIVKGLKATVAFDNSMRTTTNTGVNFFNKNTASISKYWLQFEMPDQTAFQTAVTYSANASNSLDDNDSPMMSVGNDAIYTTIEGNKLAIQGRSSFVNTDVVILGNKQSIAGNYTISLAQTEGIFSNGQAIYLRDKQLNIYTNLSSQSYTFAATAGEFTNRFEIVYLPQGSLATNEIRKNDLKVYRDDEVFVVENTAKLDKITVTDASGRLVKTLSPNANKAVIEISNKGVYIFSITSQGKTEAKKVIK